jgi:hypothetical protein
MLIQVETAIVDAPLGGDGTRADVVEDRPGDAAKGEALAPVPSGGTCLDLVMCSLGPSLPRERYAAMPTLYDGEA